MSIFQTAWLRAVKKVERIVGQKSLSVRPVISGLASGGHVWSADEKSVVEIARALERRDSLPSLSAVYRVRNGSPFLYLSVASVVPICSEIVIIDNGSNDDTLSIAERLRKDFKNVATVHISRYEQRVELPGKDYLARVRNNPESSLARYYNHAFSHASGEYLFKMDAHKIFMPFAYPLVQDKLSAGHRVLNFTGTEVFGRPLGFEPYIYRRDLGLGYVDSDHYERLQWEETISFGELMKGQIGQPLFIHLKALLYSASSKQRVNGQAAIYN